MPLRFSTTARNAMLDALASQVGSSATWKIYTGSQVASVATAVAGTELASLTCNAAGFADAASSGSINVKAITAATAGNTGTAGWFRIATSGGTAVIDGSVTATGGGGELQLSSTSISSGASISISSASITAANS